VIEATPDGLVWQWGAEVATTRATTGERGRIFVYSLSVTDGSAELVTQVPVIFGETQTRPFVTIDSPLPYAAVDTDEPVTISGRGGALFENNVVVRVIDQQGNVLFEEPTIMQTDEVGGEGRWETELPIDYVGRGRIVAFSPSPAEGTADSAFTPETSIDVIFGEPTAADAYVLVTYPLPDTPVTNNHEYYALAGYAGEALVASVSVLVQDESGNILYLLPTAVDEESGFWSTSIKLDREITRDQEIRINVLAPSTLDGSIIAADRINVNARADQAFVTGTVVVETGDPLPPNAVVYVRLLDVTRADAASSVLGEQVIVRPGTSPVPFAVGYAPAEVEARAVYAIHADVAAGDGTILYRSSNSVGVITGNNPDQGVVVEVEPVE
jgi:uncharacterized lipoprotein YbaY